MPKLTPSKPGRDVFCFMGGAYKPPNYRIWQQIAYYSDLVGRDGQVIVVVSNPRSSKYVGKHSFEDGHSMSSDQVVEVLEIFAEADGRDNVSFMASEEPSPVRTIYGLVTDPEVVSDADVLIGCYNDEADFKKWSTLPSRVAAENPSVTLLDFRKFAFRRSYENFAHGISELQRRIGGMRLANEEDALPSFLSKEQMDKCLKLIYGPDYAANGTEEKDEGGSGKEGDAPEDGKDAGKLEEGRWAPEGVEETVYEDFDEFVSDWKGSEFTLSQGHSQHVAGDDLVLIFHVMPDQAFIVKGAAVHADDWKDFL